MVARPPGVLNVTSTGLCGAPQLRRKNGPHAGVHAAPRPSQATKIILFHNLGGPAEGKVRIAISSLNYAEALL